MYHLKKYKDGSERGPMVYIEPHVGYNSKTKKVEYNNWEELKKLPLTFDILTSGTLIWARTDETDRTFSRSITYSKNHGDSVRITASLGNSTTIDVNAGDTLTFICNIYDGYNNVRGYSENQDTPPPACCGFKDGTATFNVRGNFVSAVKGNDYLQVSGSYPIYARHFFQNAGVVDASELVFSPSLSIFPDIDYFFKDCALLTGPPQLPYGISTLAGYKGLFSGCTSLKKAPALTSTSLSSSSSHYLEMFKDCTSLEEAPLLPAPQLRNYNYQDMFNGCTNLKKVEAYFFTGWAGFIQDWLKNINSSGKLIVNQEADSTTKLYINQSRPSGWTRINSFYKTTSVPLYHRYINTGITINQNDKIYCKFVGKEENVIIGSETEENVNKFKIYINSSHQLCVNFTDSQGTEYNHIVPISLTDGINEFELDLSTLVGRLNNGSFSFGHGDNYGFPVSGAHYLYVHAMNRGSNSEIVDLSNNEFDLRELKITSSTDSIKYHIVPISFYGRRCFVKWGSGDAVMVYPTKYVQSS